ncbi:hypothetical protein HY837_00595 [archaeon]|nr:hypothetical protein [archaeon]
MARIVGEIKPDWTVVKYETKEDFEEIKEKGSIYDLCRGLISADLVIDANPKGSNYVKDGTCFVMVRLNLDSIKARVKISPQILDFPGLEGLVAKINPQFIDKEWHEFSSYEKMVEQVAKDHSDWVVYSKEKNDFDVDELWSPTDAGYNLVFPIWRDVERILFKN